MTNVRSAHRRAIGAARFVGLLAAGVLLASGCGGQVVGAGADAADPVATPVDRSSATADPGVSADPESLSTGPRVELPRERQPAWEPSDGRARDARVTIPRLGIENLEVRSYGGSTDDAAGHAIQNTGIAASPTGPAGGVGPGGVGNYQVTGHRTSSTRIFEFLPRLVRGDRIRVRAAGTVYVYKVTGTRITSFRSERSLREQRAPVPGRPGAKPTRAMITVSTCRTQEDHAEGNYWSDQFDNPEHRIDKIAVLVKTLPA